VAKNSRIAMSGRQIISLGLTGACCFWGPVMASAEASFTCKEVQRRSYSFSSSMAPAYPGRSINFSIRDDKITAYRVFFHSKYSIEYLDPAGENISFRAHAYDDDREDIFLFTGEVLFHTAIVKYGMEPSIQLNILECRSEKG